MNAWEEFLASGEGGGGGIVREGTKQDIEVQHKKEGGDGASLSEATSL